MKNLAVFILLFISFSMYGQRYKSMMEDRSINIYDVVEEAEKYFSTVDRYAKGSGWKGFQRWLSKVEPMYYPSGDRTKVDPRFAQKGYTSFLKKYPTEKLRNSSDVWEDLGPYNINNISGHYSPGIGRVEHVWESPTNSDSLYLSSRSGGFWKSIDGGITWTNTTDGLPSSGVDVFAVNPSNQNDILINVRNAGNGVTMGVYRSLDGGDTWSMTVFNPTDIGIGGLGTDEKVFDIKFNPHNNNQIYITASGFMYRSIDNLVSVQPVSNNSYQSITFHQTDPNIMFAPRNYYWDRDQVWRSTNGGQNWSLLHDISINNYRTFTVATTPVDPSLVFFASGTHVWKSTDNGVTIDTIPGAAGKGNYFAVSDVDEDILITGGIDIQMSYNGGTTWETVTDWYWPGGGTPPSDYVHADLRFSHFQNGNILCGTDGFMVKSTDNGSTWQILSNGTGIRENYRLGVSQSDNDISVCGSQDNGTSIYKGRGNDWLEWIGADGMEGIVHPLDPDRMIGSIQNGNKRRSLDGGISTSGINNHPDIGSRNWIAPLFYDPLDHMKIFTVGQTVHSSDNFGSSWNALHEFDSGSFQHLVKSENDSGIILASKGSSLYRSTDDGGTFSSVGGGTLPNKSIQDITFDPTDDDHVIVVYAHHEDDGERIFRSVDGGVSWSNITYNLSNIPARSVVIDHTDNKTIYIGTETGVFKKSWTSNQYELWSTGLSPVAIYELEIIYATNTIRAATWGRGLWERKLDGCQDFPEITKVAIDASISDQAPTYNQNISLTIDIENPDDIVSSFMKYSFNSIQLGSTQNLVRFNSNQFTLDGNMPVGNVDDKLYFKIFAVNSTGDTTETYRYMYTLRDQSEYCDAEGASGTGSDYINYVSLDGTTNNSGQDFYGDFTGTTFNLDKFETYELEVGLAAVFSPDTIFAWIDWDRSNTFDDDELINFSSFNPQNRAFATIDVPGNAITNTSLRMRIRNQYDNNNPSPCGNGIFGEVEDYTIDVTDNCASGKEVENLNNAKIGSLRYLLTHTCANDTIFISDQLTGDTLDVFQEEMLIKNSVVIVGLPASDFTISGREERRIFNIIPTSVLDLHQMKLIDCIEDPNGGAILNDGVLILTDVIFDNNKEGAALQALTNNGTITIKPGTTEIKE